LKKYIKHLILFSIILFFAISCNNNDEIINKDKFILILLDIHKGNAIFSEKKFIDITLKKKNASYYNYYFKKHNITKAQFEKTLSYYSQNLEEYLKIYDDVIAKFTEEELVFIEPVTNIFDIHKLVKDSIVRKKAYDALWIEIWNKEKKYFIPYDTTISIISDTITLTEKCKFKLNADILIYKDDSCKNHYILLKAFYKDETIDTLINDTLIKDGKFHKYKFTAKTDSIKKTDSIICSIINYPDSIKSKHLKVKNISLKKYIINIGNRNKLKKKILTNKAPLKREFIK